MALNRNHGNSVEDYLDNRVVSRRKLLGLLGASAAAVLAGCRPEDLEEL